jgi:cell wall-associated NlpC family hydrolase
MQRLQICIIKTYRLSFMQYAICTVAAAPVRKEPSHRTEMIDQLLFGQTMQVLEAKEEWFKIRSLYDNYEGWVTHHLITEIDETAAKMDVNFIATGLINPITLPNQLINAPMGSALVGFDEETRLLWDEQYKYHGTFRNVAQPFDLDLLWRTAQAWINAPYLWGGKTFMGVDCSGFVQTVFKVLGIKLLRDAYQQAEQGVATDLASGKTGDVAFFHNEKGRVTHVGIILNPGQIIHASAKLIIDELGEKGIVNIENGKRTHPLHSIKRYF